MSAVLMYSVFSFAYFNWIWRDRLAYQTGGIMFICSWPWSMFWIGSVEPHIIEALPPYVVTIERVLAVGLGLGLNLAIATTAIWWVRGRVSSRSANAHDA